MRHQVIKDLWSCWDKLTRRQQRIAWLLRQGYTNEQIAEQLGIKAATVDSHIKAITKTFKASSRMEMRLMIAELPFKKSRLIIEDRPFQKPKWMTEKLSSKPRR